MSVRCQQSILPRGAELQHGLQHQKLPAVWTNGVFSASSYPLKSPEKAVEQSDFGIAGVARWSIRVPLNGF
jgi:hypothetical protein